MSLQFSNTTTKRGLVQFYEKEIGQDYGYVSNNTERLAEFTARVGKALDDYILIWAKNAGTWQADDINHTDFQIITTNLVSGQRDYSWVTDENGNRVVDLSKVLILPSATSTDYIEIYPVDETNVDMTAILTGTAQGVPGQYGKMSNSILLDPIPSYNATNGLKMVVNREGSYPVVSDTTKIIGVPVYHEYFYLKPAYEKARINNLANRDELEKAIVDLEGSERLGVTGKIADFFSKRAKDERNIMSPKKILYI